MLPDFKIAGLYLYDIFNCIAVIAALAVLRVYGDKKNMPAKVINFFLLLSAAAIVGGFGFAVLFQAVYNGLGGGSFSVDQNTGMTFLGGLIGGAAVFAAGYFIFGRLLFKGKEHTQWLKTLLNIAPCSIVLAHAVGRIGCFTAGCCHGRLTGFFLGVNFPDLGKAHPTQLYESVFLFALFALFSILYFKNKNLNMPLYLVCYGVFRFLIEFLRGDERGGFFIKALSPSQGISIILAAGGAAWLILLIRKAAKPYWRANQN